MPIEMSGWGGGIYFFFFDIRKYFGRNTRPIFTDSMSFY